MSASRLKVIGLCFPLFLSLALSPTSCCQRVSPLPNTPSVTFTEGSPITIDFTVTNNTNETISSLAVFGGPFDYLGDPADAIISTGSVSGSCLGSPVGSGSSCGVSVPYFTGSLVSPEGPENADSGVSLTSIRLQYVCQNCPDDTDAQGPAGIYSVTSPTVQFIVTDPVSTPDPPSLLLLGTGLLAFGPLLRHRRV